LSYKHHFKLVSVYNSRVNNQLYKAALNLSKSELNKDMGAFFGSVLGTLNHVLVGDLLWLDRFKNHSDEYISLKKIYNYPTPRTLSEVLYSNFEELNQVRKEVDEIITNWINGETNDIDFEQNLTYQNSRGSTSSRHFGEVVSHFFNHQTHHRGQASTLLSQLGYDMGVTDFIIDIPEEQA